MSTSVRLSLCVQFNVLLSSLSVCVSLCSCMSVLIPCHPFDGLWLVVCLHVLTLACVSGFSNGTADFVETSVSVCPSNNGETDLAVTLAAGSLSDCFEQGAMPTAAEASVLGHAHPVHVWCVVLHCGSHLHPHLHHHPPGQCPSSLPASCQTFMCAVYWICVMHSGFPSCLLCVRRPCNIRCAAVVACSCCCWEPMSAVVNITTFDKARRILLKDLF